MHGKSREAGECLAPSFHEIGSNRNKLKKTATGDILHEDLRKQSAHGQSIYDHRTAGFVTQEA
jgi:hypothetical protein